MNWQAWLIGTGVIVGVSAFLRFVPKDKINEKVEPWARRMGALVSALLLSKLPRKAAERVEEGVICTLVDVIGAALLAFEGGLLADNKDRLQKEETDGATDTADN